MSQEAYYIFIINFYNTEIVGVFSILNTIAFLIRTVFSLGLRRGAQHFIACHLGREEDGIIRPLFRKFAAEDFLLASAALTALWFLSPSLTLLFFHPYAYLDYLRLMDVELFTIVINYILFYMLLGLQSFRTNEILNIFNYALGYDLIIPSLLVNSNPIRIIFTQVVGYFAI